MRAKISRWSLAVSACVALLATGLQAQETRSLGALYLPDLVDARLATTLDGGIVASASLPEVMPFNADLVNAENVAADGAGVYVAVLDTGLLPQWPFFFPQADIAWDLGKGFSHDIYWDDALQDIVIGPLQDDRGFITGLASGHGTHVTSTVVGFNVNNAFWVRGIAPRVKIIPVLVLDAWLVDTPFGQIGLSGGTDEMISAGIRYVAELELDGPVVINMSLGGPDRSPIIEEAVDYAIGKGVIVVASAGNSGMEGMGYPGGLPQIISAAAGGWTQTMASGANWRGDVPEKLNSADVFGNNWQIYLEDFSSRPNMLLGQKHQDLDVAGPGAWIVGPYKSAFQENLNYYYLSGTSMAAPHVSAIAALALQGQPGLGQPAMEQLLKNAARGTPLAADGAVVAFFPSDPAYYIQTWQGGDYGAGLLKADEALR